MSPARDKAAPLRGKNVVLGVSGGIAAYKAAELARLLVKEDARVRAAMTRAAQEFITPMTLQTLTGNPVGTELFDLTQESEIGHIKLAQDADLVILAPATANLIAKMAHGLADDLLTTLLLVTRAPILMAPAMNVNMWEHPMVQDNVARLVEKVGVHVVGPGAGFLACKMVGPGRLAEPADIVEAARRVLTERDLEGKRVVVSAGPTREALDPVRFLSNRSTGKMGYAVARAAAARGAAVTLVSGPTSMETPLGVARIDVSSAADMAKAVKDAAKDADVVVMAAAVSDYRPGTVAPRKLKKDELGDAAGLPLERTEDILASLGKARASGSDRRPFLVGFAAETHDVEAYARRKLAQKGCDLVVANDVSAKDAGFEVDTNRVVLVGPGKDLVHVGLAKKDEIAHAIWDHVAAAIRGTPRRRA